jgi:sugar phosphate isomerase/epimerase
MHGCTRREFTTTLAAIAAGTAWPRWTAGQGAIPASIVAGVHVGVQSYTFRTFNFDRLIAAMRSIGLSNVELWGDGLDHPLHPLRQTEADFKRVKARLDEAGITVTAYCTNFPNDVTPDYLDRAFRGAGLLGARVLTTSCEKSVLDQLDRWATKYQVKVGLHNHWNGDRWFVESKKDPKANFEGPDDWAEAFKGRSEWLAINLDIGHFSAAGFDPVAFFRQHHSRIVSVHVKDRAADPEHAYTRFGRGATPIAAFCRAAKELRFPYALNIEYEMDERDPTEGVRDAFGYVKQALTQTV